VIAKGKIGPLLRILLCDSGADSRTLLGRFTAQLAELLTVQMEVTVLHVMSQISAGPRVSSQQLRADAQELIEKHSPEGELLDQDIRFLQQHNVQPRPAASRPGGDEIPTEARSGIMTCGHRGASRPRMAAHLARRPGPSHHRGDGPPALVVR
jgi:hypothetical protein